MPPSPHDENAPVLADRAPRRRAGISAPQSGQGRCLPPYTPRPCRPRPISRRCGSARWSAQSLGSNVRSESKVRQVNESAEVWLRPEESVAEKSPLRSSTVCVASQETAAVVLALEQRRLGHEELSLKSGSVRLKPTCWGVLWP